MGANPCPFGGPGYGVDTTKGRCMSIMSIQTPHRARFRSSLQGLERLKRGQLVSTLSPRSRWGPCCSFKGHQRG